MRTVSYILFLPIFVIFCCHPASKESVSDLATIEIRLDQRFSEKLQGKWLYLYSATKKDNAIDSVKVSGQKVKFEVSNAKESIPFRAKLAYKDTTTKQNVLDYYKEKSMISFLRPVGISNPYTKNAIESFFYVDFGETVLVPDQETKSLYLTSKLTSESRQNEPMFKHLQFYLTHDSSKLPAAKESNINLIRQFPNSYYLLDQLFVFRDHFQESELEIYLTIFDSTVYHSSNFQRLKQFLAFKSKKDLTIVPNFKLETESTSKKSIFDNSKPNKLIIFWASWCAPCRAEIPELKNLYHKYSGKSISFISISIDEDRDRWLSAVKTELMPWSQFIINRDIKDEIYMRFSISSIPLMYLIDGENKMVARYDDASDKNITDLQNRLQALSSQVNK